MRDRAPYTPSRTPAALLETRSGSVFSGSVFYTRACAREGCLSLSTLGAGRLEREGRADASRLPRERWGEGDRQGAGGGDREQELGDASGGDHHALVLRRHALRDSRRSTRGPHLAALPPVTIADGAGGTVGYLKQTARSTPAAALSSSRPWPPLLVVSVKRGRATRRIRTAAACSGGRIQSRLTRPIRRSSERARHRPPASTC
jgi:hypothetical protein